MAGAISSYHPEPMGVGPVRVERSGRGVPQFAPVVGSAHIAEQVLHNGRPGGGAANLSTNLACARRRHLQGSSNIARSSAIIVKPTSACARST